MVRRLGGLRWRLLHQIVYGIALLALVHYFQQTKADVTVPIFAASLFLWLIAYRLIAYRLVAWWQDSRELSTLTLLGLSIAVSVLTFIGEAVGIGIAYHVSPMRVLDVAFDFSAGIRPGWQVLAAGLVVVAIDSCAGAGPSVRHARAPPAWPKARRGYFTSPFFCTGPVKASKRLRR